MLLLIFYKNNNFLIKIKLSWLVGRGDLEIAISLESGGISEGAGFSIEGGKGGRILTIELSRFVGRGS